MFVSRQICVTCHKYALPIKQFAWSRPRWWICTKEGALRKDSCVPEDCEKKMEHCVAAAMEKK